MGLDIASLIGGAAGTGVKDVLQGIGGLAKDLRQAITGKDPQTEAKLLEMEKAIDAATISVALAEASSQDKWTSRARPAFMYVIYIYILFAIPMGFWYAAHPVTAKLAIEGMQAFLKAIPTDLWALFGAGYLGYGAFRSYDKKMEVKANGGTWQPQKSK